MKRNNKKPFGIWTPRQERLIRALLEHDKISANALRDVAGASNISQAVVDLRSLGWVILGWVINMKRISIKDRDGKPCKPGRYFLSKEMRRRAEQALREYSTRSAATEQADIMNNDFKTYGSTGGVI